MRNWLRTLLFITAFSPVLVTIAYIKYSLQGWGIEVAQLLFVGMLGSLLPLLVVKLIENQGELFVIEAKKVESNDFMLIAFVSSYLLPLVLKAADLSVGSISIIIFILYLIFWLISSLPAHPLLRLFKFKFYKVESSNGIVYTLISRREIIDPKQIKAVKKVSGTMIMEIYDV